MVGIGVSDKTFTLVQLFKKRDNKLGHGVVAEVGGNKTYS